MTDSDRESFQLRDSNDSTQSRNSLDVRADLPRLQSAAGAQPWIAAAAPSGERPVAASTWRPEQLDLAQHLQSPLASAREAVLLLASLFGFLWLLFFGFWWFPVSGFCLFIFCAIASDIRGRNKPLGVAQPTFLDVAALDAVL